MVNCHWLLGTHHLHISHNTFCLLPKILYILCFQFLLGITVVPGEIENNAYATFWRKNNSGRCANGELHIWAYRTHFKDLLEWPPNNSFPMCNFPKQPLLNQVYFVVHFYPWCKPYFPLFQSFNHTLPLTLKQRKIKFQRWTTTYTPKRNVFEINFFSFWVTGSPKENGDGDLSNSECFLKHHHTFICSRACVAARLVMGKPFFPSYLGQNRGSWT